MTLYELDEMFGELIKQFPERKAQLVEGCGEKLYQGVIENIERNVSEDTGNLKSGVTKVIGSGGGYAAVKPDWKKAPHTHLVENGHQVIPRGRSKRTKRLRFGSVKPKSNRRYTKKNKEDALGWVAGKHMYRNALNSLANELEQDAQNMMRKLVGDVFG